jgi:hypothetical protein
MKIRNGFVSNSSSSSFLIAIKSTNEACPCCGRKDLDANAFLELIRNSHNEDNVVNASGDGINDYITHNIINNYYYESEEQKKAEKERYQNLLNDYTNKDYIPDKIVFGLFGKLEITRKRTLKTLSMWAKKYGNNPKYVLHAAIANPHMKPEDQSRLILNALEGKKYWNITFLPMVQSNAEYNDIINSVNIVLALSGGEAFGLPEFHAVGLGKHCVGLNAHAYKDYMNDSNSVLINPSSKIPCYDGIFFHEGQPFNQGNFYDWDEDEAIAAMEQAEQRYAINPVNIAGQELKKWTYEDTIKEIVENL